MRSALKRFRLNAAIYDQENHGISACPLFASGAYNTRARHTRARRPPEWTTLRRRYETTRLQRSIGCAVKRFRNGQARARTRFPSPSSPERRGPVGSCGSAHLSLCGQCRGDVCGTTRRRSMSNPRHGSETRLFRRFSADNGQGRS